MTDQPTDRARKAAEEIARVAWGCQRDGGSCNYDCEFYGECRDGVESYSAIIERHCRECAEEKNKNIERIRRFNESEILRFAENHKEAAPCPEK